MLGCATPLLPLRVHPKFFLGTPWPLHHSHHTRHLLSHPPRHAGPHHQSPRRRPKLTGCSKRAGIGFLALFLVRCFTCKMLLFLRGRCWVRTSDLLLVS